MPAPSRLTIEFDSAVSARPEALADREGKDPAELAPVAVAEFVALYSAQIPEIEAALREADTGDFAIGAEVAAVFARWGAPQR